MRDKRRSRNCCRLQETKETLQPNAVWHPRLGTDVIKDITGTFDQIGMWLGLLAECKVKFPEFGNCAGAVSQGTHEILWIKVCVICNLFSSGLGTMFMRWRGRGHFGNSQYDKLKNWWTWEKECRRFVFYSYNFSVTLKLFQSNKLKQENGKENLRWWRW